MNISPMPPGLIWLIWLLPLTAFAVINLLRLLPRRPDPGWVAIAAMLGSLGLSAWALASLLGGTLHEIALPGFEWLSIGSVHISFNLAVDPLSAIMLMVVTVVALMVQIYSRGYMHGDPGIQRYYAFLSLFAFAMLGLVLAGNLLLLFICWELVGLCSYLLIGFWFHKPEAAAAAKKAFLVTRIGDVGFLAAILALYASAGTLDIAELHALAAAGAIGAAVLTWACIGLFLGAMGKSAQFPLHIWLPDAMEGPTPVSALIHAATMVAAGVYLVARMYPLFEAAPGVLTGIAVIGGFTAFFAATMGLVMTDIKRVLAYSTISQLGFMMIGLATGGVAVGIFHLFNHAFFKALLFMGAGSVSHAVGTFDMREMGGLRKAMPWTFATFLMGSLSLAGVWPFSGFFSKEEILGRSLERNPVFFAVLLLTAFMTAFYIFRVIFKTFTGHYRGQGRHPHESPAAMLIPMIILAALALGSGWLNASGWFNSFLGHGETHSWVEGLLGMLTHPLAWASLAAAGLGLLLAYLFYGSRRFASAAVRERFATIYRLLKGKYWMDELYENVIARSLLYRGLFRAFAWFDSNIIDGAVNGLAWLGIGGGRAARRVQTGQLQLYGIAAIFGLVALIIILALVR
jgi:NADH-quinone oxidoreductase subunit L